MMETMERLLLAWIDHCNQQNIHYDMTTIQAKAKDFYQKVRIEQDLSELTPKQQRETFLASKGWYNNFKKRTGIIVPRATDQQSGVVTREECASPHMDTQEDLQAQTQDQSTNEEFCPQE